MVSWRLSCTFLNLLFDSLSLVFSVDDGASLLTNATVEKYDEASSGKYVIGLGQETMAFLQKWEDVNSMCLTGNSEHLHSNH